MRAKEKHKHTKNDKEKGTGMTKYTGQRKIDEGHSIERVIYIPGVRQQSIHIMHIYSEELYICSEAGWIDASQPPVGGAMLQQYTIASDTFCIPHHAHFIPIALVVVRKRGA